MSVQAIELRRQRAEVVAKARAVLDKAEAEKRKLNTEEAAEYKRLDDAIDDLGDRAGKLEKQERLEAELAAAVSDDPPPASEPGRRAAAAASKGDAPDLDLSAFDKSDLPARWRDYVAGIRNMPEAARSAFERRSAQPYCSNFRGYLMDGVERRDLQADSDTAGGFLVPLTFVARLIRALENQVVVRQAGATVIPVGDGRSLGAPALANEIGDPTWTAEIGTGSNDTTMSFGSRELHPHPLARRIKVSNKLLRSAALDPEAIVAQTMAYKFAVVQDTAYLTGTGANQPLGVFTASTSGVDTGRDITGASATGFNYDDLVDVLHGLKVQYRANARWIAHREWVKRCRKLKDSNGMPIWSAGGNIGAAAAPNPDTVLGVPVLESEYAPSTFTTGLYVSVVGDFSFYWIADAMNMTVQRLVELYAETNQVGFIGRYEGDGMPVVAEAFARQKLA